MLRLMVMRVLLVCVFIPVLAACGTEPGSNLSGGTGQPSQEEATALRQTYTVS